MFYVEEIELRQAEALLKSCNLTLPQGVDYTAGAFREDGKLVATGSLKGDMIQAVAVDPAFQGEDLTAKVLTHLIGKAKTSQSLYLFTKPEKVMQFRSLGFRLVAMARPYAALLEWGEEGVKQYMEGLSSYKKDDNDAGALVMNCNPFTLGHRYLIEEAAKRCKNVYVLAVEEDISLFSFADRLEMIKRGTADLENVTVIPGGRYAVSTLTFPSYFTKEEELAYTHAAMDGELFAEAIAPPLCIKARFLGTEPLSPVTNIYNQTLKTRLPKKGISVTEIPRLEVGGEPVSASRVRKLIEEEWLAKGTLADLVGSDTEEKLRELLPESTMTYLFSKGRKVTLMELLNSRENRAVHQKKLLETYGGTLISVTLNIPGPVKDKPSYRRALDLGMERISEKIGYDAIVVQEKRFLVTGSEGYICVDEKAFDARALKKITVSVEEADQLGRLFDIDVLTREGGISRADLGVGMRKCLLCDGDAKVCARSQKHPMEELLGKIDCVLEEAGI